MWAIIGVIGGFLFLTLLSAIYIIHQYDRGVVFTFGRLTGVLEPGLRIVIPFVQTVYRIDMRTITMDVPTQDIITRDNVPVAVNAVVFYQVIEPQKAVE